MVQNVYADFSPTDMSWTNNTRFFVSWNEPENLPTNVKHGTSLTQIYIGAIAKTLLADAEYLCRVEFDMTGLRLEDLETMKGPKKGLLKVQNRKYHRANFEIRMIIGSADLRFEVWFKGKRYGESHVSIDWG